ncbi:MAG: hypothetical protein IJQ10_03025 [Clostridia bacterium]|nr:hypothetical protein [Clostridia bacterium]
MNKKEIYASVLLASFLSSQTAVKASLDSELTKWMTRTLKVTTVSIPLLIASLPFIPVVDYYRHKNKNIKGLLKEIESFNINLSSGNYDINVTAFMPNEFSKNYVSKKFSINDLRNILLDEIPPKDVSKSSDDTEIVKFLLDFAVKCNNINKNRASLLIKDSFELIFDLKNSKRIEIICLDHSKKEVIVFRIELSQKNKI